MAFTVEFKRLWAAANPPSQRAFAAAAAERARKENISVTESAFRNRVSDWLNGRLPAKDSEALPIVLRELFAIADRKGRLRGVPTSIAHWESLLDASDDTDDDRCPYKGLEAYGREDARQFFGRSEATSDVMRLVSQATESGGFVIVAGASGAGKSSLLAAGVIPAVTREYAVPVLSLTPGAHPISSLSGRSGAQPPAMGTDEEWRNQVQRWIGNFRKLVQDAGGTQGLIFVDQFEEIFTVTEDQTERARFIDALASITARGEDGSPSPAVVVIGVRADFLGQLLNIDAFEESLRTRLYFLRAMNARELHEAITEPARQAHLTLEPGLEQAVIRDVCGPDGQSQTEAGALPLLSHALAATWQNRQRNRLTVAGYEKAGRAAGALGRTADTVMDGLDPAGQAAARHIVMRLVHIGDDTRDTRRPRSRIDLLDFPTEQEKAAETAFGALTAARLITIDADTVNLAHEALITAWPRLRDWIEEDRAGQLVLQRLERAADDWEAHGRDKHQLYAGTQLDNADAVTAASAPALTTRAKDFLEQSRAQQAAQVRTRRNLIAAGAFIAVMILVLAVVAGVAARSASVQRDAAQFGQLAAEAQRLALADPSMSAQLNLIAHDLNPDDKSTYTRLLTTENLPLATLMTGQQGAIYTIAVSPDGRTLASSAYDNSIWLWNISDQTKPVKITQIGGACATENACEGHENFVTSVAFSPDGKTLASTGGDKTVRLWDISNLAHPKQLAKLTDHTGTVYYCAWSPDGKILVTGSGDNTVRLWNTADVHHPIPGAVLTGHAKGVRTVAFSPDGHTIASGGDDRTVRLWDVTNANTAAPLGQPLTGHTDTTHNVTFSPDGSMLASGADDNTIRLWSLTDRAAPTLLGQPFSGHTGPIWSVSFGPDGHTLATSSLDNTAKVFNILNPAKPIQVGQTLAGGGSSIYSVAYTKGGRTIATSDASGTIRLWSIPTTTLTGHAGRVIKPAIAHERMASASYDGTVNLWDIHDPAHTKVLDTVHDPAGRNVYEVALSPDGKLLATAIVDSVNGSLTGSVEIRAIGPDGQLTLLTTLHVPSQYQDHVVFSPNSRILATASNDNGYQLWSLTDPAQPKKLGQPLIHSAPTTTGNAQWATAAAFSPDGNTLVLSGADKELTLWDIRNPATAKKLDATIKAHEKAINYVAFSPDGHTVASGGDDRTIKLWNVHDGKIEPISTLTGLPNTIRTLEFTDHGNKLVSAGDGQIVLLWDTTDPARPTQIGDPISIPGNGRWYAAVDPSATMVVAGGDNGALQITILDEKYAEDRICHDTHNVMNETLWAEHVPNGIDYNPPCSQ